MFHQKHLLWTNFTNRSEKKPVKEPLSNKSAGLQTAVLLIKYSIMGVSLGIMWNLYSNNFVEHQRTITYRNKVLVYKSNWPISFRCIEVRLKRETDVTMEKNAKAVGKVAHVLSTHWVVTWPTLNVHKTFTWLSDRHSNVTVCFHVRLLLTGYLMLTNFKPMFHLYTLWKRQ